ncbi:MAG: hypothetical protein WBJ81_01010 [Rickettsiales bacterium]
MRDSNLYQLLRINMVVHNKNSEHLPEGYRVAYTSDQLHLSKKGYYGVAVINNKMKQIVICSAGTGFNSNNLLDLMEDMESNSYIMQGKLPKQYDYALKFTKYSLEHLPADYKIIITGYSLGGILADLVTYSLASKYPNKLKDITFENPGSYNLILKNFANQDVKQVKEIQASFKSYNSAKPNLVNIFDKQIGEVVKICLNENKFSENFSKNKIINQLIDGHLFSNFISGAIDEHGNVNLCGNAGFYEVDA